MEHVRESIRQVDENTWLIGPLILRRSGGYSDTATWYDQDADLGYTIADAPNPPPPSVLLSEDHPDIVKVYDAGDATAVWSVGNSACCKVKLRLSGTAREPSTIRFVQQRQPGFETPNVLHEVEYNGRSCLFISRVPGRTLGEAWPTLENEWKHRYVKAIVRACETLASWKSDTLRGVDGNAPERFLAEYRAENPSFDPEILQKACESIGMDCSKFFFFHADLGPTNIIVEKVPKTGSIGIIDWENAAYYPRGWIRTKFAVSSGMDLPSSVTEDPSTWWRYEVQKLLGERGFEEYTEVWINSRR